MSQALRKLTSVVNKTKTCLIFTNQLREKIGVTYGNPEVTPGGRALKFYASVRIEMRAGESLKTGPDLIGKKIRVKVTKNKVAPPFTEAEFEMIFGEGISKEGDILDTGVEMGIIQRSGAWYSYGEHKLGQGRDKAKEFFRENPQIAAEIEGKIREVINAQKGTGEMPEKTTAEEEEETVEEAAN